VQNHLRDALPVPKVQEDNAAVVAPAVNPPVERYLFAGIGRAELTAPVGPQERTAR
jgi:hypothetical protein